MTNNDDQAVDLENNEEVEEPEAEAEDTDTEPEPTDRVKELEAELAKFKRIAARKAKQAEATEEAPSTTKPSSDLDYGQKAFLKTYGIQGSDELQLARDFMKRTGDDLDSIVSDDIFQAKLTKLREARAAVDAVPKSTNRSQASTTSDVDYWKGKVESGQATLNDIPDVAIRRQVLNARIEHERVGSQFSDKPVQMS